MLIRNINGAGFPFRSLAEIARYNEAAVATGERGPVEAGGDDLSVGLQGQGSDGCRGVAEASGDQATRTKCRVELSSAEVTRQSKGRGRLAPSLSSSYEVAIRLDYKCISPGGWRIREACYCGSARSEGCVDGPGRTHALEIETRRVPAQRELACGSSRRNGAPISLYGNSAGPR